MNTNRLLFYPLLYLCAGGCGLASSLPPIPETLHQAGKAVETFWEHFSAINCTESVSQLKVGKEGKVMLRKESVFDYVVLLREADEDLVVEESRVVLRSAGDKKRGSLLVTNGFSTLLFIFHPVFQNSFEYSQPVEEEIDGRQARRVDFRQVRAGRSPSCFRMKGRDCPVEWAGTAWIDPRSGAVLRITASLASSMEDVGLKELTATVSYAPVKFASAPEEHWLPAVATIDARTPQQHWQNVHRFTNYRQFTVNSNTRTENPK